MKSKQLKNLKIILEEEVERIVESLPTDCFIPVLQSLLLENDNIVLKSLKDYVNGVNSDNQIPIESWNWFRDILKNLAKGNSRFQFKCREINNKLYAVKYYTKLPFSISNKVEEELKFELKKYFKDILYEDADNFIEKFFSLPFEFVSLVVRYLSNILVPENKNQLKTSLKEANIFLKEIIKKKNDFIININKISLGQAENFSFKDLSLLLDVKAFYDYNALNNAVLEFVLKLLNSNAKQKLKDLYGTFKIDYLKAQILTHPSYLKFLKNIKDGVERPYFDSKGFQNQRGSSFPSFDDLVKKYFMPEEFIPSTEKKSIPSS